MINSFDDIPKDYTDFFKAVYMAFGKSGWCFGNNRISSVYGEIQYHIGEYPVLSNMASILATKYPMDGSYYIKFSDMIHHGITTWKDNYGHQITDEFIDWIERN